MKIIKLTAQNVKRLTAVEIQPDGSLVVIGGRNAQGKTSVLDAIQYALGGATDDKMPVRRGESRGKVVVDLGDIVVRRSFTAEGGTALVVEDADGKPQRSPQAILDALVGRLTFDPLEFSRQKPAAQAETLRKLVGIDFTALDTKRQQIYDARTSVNREAKALSARIDSMPKHEGVPENEIPVSQVIDEQAKAAETNRQNQAKRDAAGKLSNDVLVLSAEAKKTRDSIASLQSQLAREEQLLKELNVRADEAHKEVASLIDVDLAPFKTKAAEVEATNAKVRQNRDRASVVSIFKAKNQAADELTKQLEDIDAEKRKATNDAKWPIAGLGFDTAGGVTLNGIPLEQASSAEQLRLSVAIGLALNPKLKVLLIRDGSLLDDEALKQVAQMAEQNDAQVWIERVGKDAATSVVIEDGMIAGTKTEQSELPIA